jgi:hypothetical protein
MMIRSLCRLALLSMLIAGASGCAPLDPYVFAKSSIYYDGCGKRKSTDEQRCGDPKSLDSAVAFAERARDNYRRAARQNVMSNRVLGGGVLAATAGGAFAAISGANLDLLTGLAVGGSAMVLASGALNQPMLNRIYAEGSAGIDCVLAAYAHLRAASSSEIRNQLTEAQRLRASLELTIADAQLKRDPLYSYAQQVLTHGQEVEARATTVLGVLASAGTRLYESAQSVQTQVGRAISQQALIDLGEFRSELAAAVPQTSGLIGGVAAPTEPQKPAGVSAKAAFETAAENYAVAIARLKTLVEQIDAGPTDGDLKQCTLDISKTGLDFKVSPANVLTLNVKTLTPATILIKGGKPPYHRNWQGASPAHVTLGAIDHDSSGSGEAILTLTPESGVAVSDQPFRLRVSDNGAGERVIGVYLEATSASPSAIRPTNDPKIETVQAIQSILIARKCLLPVENGKTAADGKWGPNSAKALEKFVANIEDEQDRNAMPSIIGPYAQPDLQKAIEQLDANAGVYCK